MIHPEKIELTLSRIFRLSIKIAFGTFYLIRIEKMLECYRQKRIKSIIKNICFQFQYKLDLNTQLQRVSAMFEQEVSTSLQEACLSKKKMVSRSDMLFVSKYLYSGRNNYSTDVKITGKSGFFSSLQLANGLSAK